MYKRQVGNSGHSPGPHLHYHFQDGTNLFVDRGLPVFSRKWGQGKPFNEVVMEPPIGSGPYKIGPGKFGKDITYVRDPDYWAKDLNVRRGTANFDRINVKIYKDNTARLEASCCKITSSTARSQRSRHLMMFCSALNAQIKELLPYERLHRTYEGFSVHEVVQNYRWDSFEATYDCPPADAMARSGVT